MFEHNQLTDAAITALERRAMFKKAGTGLAGAVALGMLAGTGASSPAAAATTPQPTGAPTQTDVNILNFALNLEYLEAQYYLNALTGTGLSQNDLNGGTLSGTTYTIPGGTPVAAGQTAVSFDVPIIRQFAQTIAADEQAHVRFIKAALSGAQAAGVGTGPVAAPVLDVTAGTVAAPGAFTVLARAAKLIDATQVFNPYADEINFLLGAYIFEDVGVTAYGGAAALISQASGLVQYAASILAVEAYHSGTVRTLLSILGGGAATDAVSNLRSTLSSGSGEGTAQGDDYGTLDTTNNVVVLAPLDANALTYRRSVAQVLKIVYGNTGGAPGLFFPQGLNQQVGQTGFA